MKRGLAMLVAGLLAVTVTGLSGCMGAWGHAPYKSDPHCGWEWGHGHHWNRVDSETGYSSQALCTENGKSVPCTRIPPKRKPCLETRAHQYDYGCGHDTTYFKK